MSVLDFNTAEVSKPIGELMPDKTIAPVIMSLRGEKATKAGDAMMLDCEFTVLEGPYARRKFWGMMMITSNGSKGHDTAVDITRQRVRGMLESAYGINPADDSEAAMNERRLNAWQDLDSIEFLACIGVEKSKDPKYDDKNVLKYAVTPDSEDYEGFTPAKAPAKTMQTAQTASAGGSKWR